MNDSIPVDHTEAANLTTRLDRMPLTRTNIIISTLLLTVWMCEAFDMGVMSIMLVFVKDLWQLTPTDQSLLGISATVGVAIGAVFAGRLMDLYGRKKVLIIGVAAFSILTLACAAFPNKYWIIIVRFLAGLAIGAVYPVPYLFISELVGKKWRGTVIGFCMGFMVIFYAVPSLVGAWILGNFPPEVAWRIPFLIGGVPFILVFFLIKWVPESPRWSLENGHVEEVRTLVEKIEDEAGLEHDVTLVNPAIMRSLEHAHDATSNGDVGIRTVLSPPYLYRFITCFMSGAGCIVGAYVLLVYAPMIFTDLLGAADAFKFTAAMLFSGFFGAIVVERLAVALGRKITFTIFTLIAAGGFIVVAYHTSVTMLVVGGIIGSIFGIGVAPFAKTYCAEQFPTHIRGSAVGLFEAILRGFGGVVAASLIPFVYVAYGVFGVFWMVAGTFLVCLVPFLIWGRETAGLSMEEASEVSTKASEVSTVSEVPAKASA